MGPINEPKGREQLGPHGTHALVGWTSETLRGYPHQSFPKSLTVYLGWKTQNQDGKISTLMDWVLYQGLTVEAQDKGDQEEL
jgi:hypothetical protein